MRFDAHAVADQIRQRFGDGQDAPFLIEVGDFKGHRANWILLSAGWHTPDEVLAELVQMCANRCLHIHAS